MIMTSSGFQSGRHPGKAVVKELLLGLLGSRLLGHEHVREIVEIMPAFSQALPLLVTE